MGDAPTWVQIDDMADHLPCCKAHHLECFSFACPVPTVDSECMHQWEPYEHSREFRSCTVNINTCAMTCGCVLSKADPDWTHKVTTVNLNSCATFENCRGDLTCTEGPDYAGCAPGPPPKPFPNCFTGSFQGCVARNNPSYDRYHDLAQYGNGVHRCQKECLPPLPIPPSHCTYDNQKNCIDACSSGSDFVSCVYSCQDECPINGVDT